MYSLYHIYKEKHRILSTTPVPGVFPAPDRQLLSDPGGSPATLCQKFDTLSLLFYDIIIVPPGYYNQYKCFT